MEPHFCKICDVKIFSNKFWIDHLQGKKHLQMVAEKDELNALAKRSIYLNNFKHKVEEEEIRSLFDQFGEVDRVIVDKSGKNAFAIVEFKEEEAASNLLGAVQRVKIGKSLVRIRLRKVDFVGFDASNSPIIVQSNGLVNSKSVLEFLQEYCSEEGFSTQIDALIQKFMLSKEKIEERVAFGQQLQQHFQRYFSSPLHIRIFGSTVTGLGFADSDLDLYIIFDGQELQFDLPNTERNLKTVAGCSSPSTSIASHASSLELDDVQHSAENLAKNPMDGKTFMQFSKINKVRLLNALMNAFRKESALITAHVPVKDARTPVLRFFLRSPRGLPCELSIHNLFGECKANLVRDLAKAETSGRLWRLLFLLKIWATANGLFLSEDTVAADQKSHWNSYTLSLSTIAYLQSIGRVPPISKLLRPQSRKINGWAMEYELLPTFVLDKEIPELLKGLFTFTFLNLKSTNVVSLSEGRVFNAKEFKEKNSVDDSQQLEKLWRFSFVNIQDPLELSHNVAANVGKASLAKLRWKITYAISILKHPQNDCLQRLFQLDSVEKLREQNKIEKKKKSTSETQQMEGIVVGNSPEIEEDEEMELGEIIVDGKNDLPENGAH